jgi:hypothetical protein
MRSRHGRRKAPVMKPNISSTSGEGGSIIFSIEGKLPAPTIAENPKYPWSPWQVQFQEKALEKAAENILLAASNLAHVKATVENRTRERNERRAASKAAALREQLAAVEAPGAQPMAAPAHVEGGTECSEAPSTQQQPASGCEPRGRTRSAGKRRSRG